MNLDILARVVQPPIPYALRFYITDQEATAMDGDAWTQLCRKMHTAAEACMGAHTLHWNYAHTWIEAVPDEP
jgi:hypothetical protein